MHRFSMGVRCVMKPTRSRKEKTPKGRVLVYMWVGLLEFVYSYHESTLTI
jgi:hypothetical protein